MITFYIPYEALFLYQFDLKNIYYLHSSPILPYQKFYLFMLKWNAEMHEKIFAIENEKFNFCSKNTLGPFK